MLQLLRILRILSYQRWTPKWPPQYKIIITFVKKLMNCLNCVIAYHNRVATDTLYEIYNNLTGLYPEPLMIGLIVSITR